MKKAILLLSIFVMACTKPSNNRDRVIIAIKEYVKNNIPNPYNYQNTVYGKLDSAYEYPDTLDIQIEQLRGLIADTKQEDSLKTAADPQPDTTDKEFKNTTTDYQNKLNALLATPKQKHYYMIVKSHLKNADGALEASTVNYEIDTTFKIIDTN